MLKHKDWKKAMRTTYTVSDRRGEPVPETPLRMLIRVYPDLAAMAFDQCVTVEKGKDDRLPKSSQVREHSHYSKYGKTV